MANLPAAGGMWRRFLDIIPQQPRTICRITENLGNGQYIVEMAGGGTMKVRGSDNYVALDKVFITAQKIDGKAPTLTYLVIEV